jgi:hypothetical protein
VNNGVWIQDQDIIALGCPNAYIIAFGKPEVLTILNDLNAGKSFAYKLRRSIRRSIVGYDYLELGGMHSSENRAQAVAYQLEVIPAKNHDRQFHETPTS